MNKRPTIFLPLLLASCAHNVNSAVTSVQLKQTDANRLHYTVTLSNARTYDISGSTDAIASAEQYRGMVGDKKCFRVNDFIHNIYGLCN